MLQNFFPSSNSLSKSNSNNSSLEDSNLNSNQQQKANKCKNDFENNDSFNPLKNQNSTDNEKNSNEQSEEDNLSFENRNNNLNNINNNKNLLYSPDSPADKWLFKYDDNVFDDLANNDNNKRKWPQKRRKKRKQQKLQSQKLMHKILIDFINPKDLKEGLLRQKQFFRALTLNPVKYKDFDEALVKKNLKLLDLNSSESEGELRVKDIKTRDLIRRYCVLKNSNTLTKTNNKIRQNWQNIFDNPNLEENTKLKFMDILSNKSHLKNKIEEIVLDHINNILTDDINSDKNNKLSKKLIKLYREETYNLDVEKYDNEAKNAFPNPTLFSTKAKILQENKDYLISAYFDIYEDILNDVFNSGNSIFEFNEEIKGNSILRNFQIRNKNERQQAISKHGAQKDHFVNQIDSLKNAYNARRVNLFTKESLSISDRLRMQFREQSNLNSNNANNNYIINTGSLEYNDNHNNNNQMETLETRSNYDKLGLANQTYINNILLRDFSYKEKLHYIENSRSDKVSDNNNTILENTSRINDSISISTHAAAIINNAKKNTIFLKTNLIKFFKDPLKNIANNMQNNSHSSNLNQEIGGGNEMMDLNGNFDDTFDENNNNNKKKDDSDGFNDNNAIGESDNDSVGLREPVKKKKKRDAKKTKGLKFNQAASSVVNNKKNDTQPTSFFDLSKKKISL